MGPGALELVVMLAMLLAGSFSFPFGVPPEKEDPLLARVAPEECVFHTSWAGMADPDPTSGNRTEQLLAEPEVQQLIARLDQQFVQSLQMLAANAPDAKARMRNRSRILSMFLWMCAAVALVCVAGCVLRPALWGRCAQDVSGTSEGPVWP